MKIMVNVSLEDDGASGDDDDDILDKDPDRR